MKLVRTVKNSILLAFLAVFLTGCKGGVQETVMPDMVKAPAKLSMLEEPVADYEVLEAKPLIMVDPDGYAISGEKTALTVAKNIPRTYKVRKSEDGTIVYEGTVRFKDDDSTDGLVAGLIDFTDFCEEGKYYLETDLLGRSLDFEISGNKYEAIQERARAFLNNKRCTNCHLADVPFENNLSEYKNVSGGWHTNDSGEKDAVEGCLAVMDICTAYEYYPSLFPDEDGNGFSDIIDDALFEAEWLYKMQNQETGGVYTSVSYQTVSNSENKRLVIGGETTRATAYFCACMAKLSYTVSRVNSAEASKAIQAAGIAWKCLEANKEIVTDDQMFRAAVEMYRATGYDVYYRVVDAYLKENAEKEYESRTVLDGALTYLDSQRRTNVTYCSSLMSNFMSRTEDKVKAADKNRYAVESIELTSSEILRNAYEMILVEYIISNNAYTSNEEDCLHYLFGRNELSTDLLVNNSTPDDYVKLLCVAAKLASETE